MVANKRSKGGTACHRRRDSNTREQRADFISQQRRAACFAANWKHVTTGGMLHDIGDTHVAESVPAHQPNVLVGLHVRVTLAQHSTKPATPWAARAASRRHWIASTTASAGPVNI